MASTLPASSTPVLKFNWLNLEHEAAPTALNVPEAHTLQDVAPRTSLKVPAPHDGGGAGVPSLGQNAPAGQLEQTVAPCAAYLPALHMVHET
jgi:hypothetical protein